MRHLAPVLLSILSLGAFAQSGNDWVAEEVLKQLLDIKTELKALREDVARLKTGEGGGVSAPTPGRVVGSVSLGNRPRLGSETAGIAIVEFSDYECPFCYRYAQQTFPKIKRDYIDPGKILYVTRDFPLDFHPKAREAAIAAHCAAEQDAFWAMHGALFSKGRRLEQAYYEQVAKDNRLDMAAFRECLGAERHDVWLGEAIAEGGRLNVSGTPAFFIGRVSGDRIENAVLISGAQAYGVFANALNRLLQQ
jgi:protein-disulfide isomerase